MTALCLICRHRTTTHADEYACDVCTDDLRAWLAELPHQADLLREFLIPAARPRAGRIGGTGRAHSPLPVDLRVLVLLGPGHPAPVGDPADDTDTTVPLHTWLTGWAGHIAYTYPAVHRDPHGTAHTRPCEQAWTRTATGTAGICAWLTAYLPYTRTQPLITDLHHQLGDLIRRLRDLTHTTPRTHHKDAPCPACTAYRLATVDGQDGITCKACGHRLTHAEYDQHVTTLLHELDKDHPVASH